MSFRCRTHLLPTTFKVVQLSVEMLMSSRLEASNPHLLAVEKMCSVWRGSCQHILRQRPETRYHKTKPFRFWAVLEK